MIKFRYSSFESHVGDRDIEIVEGEKLDALMARVLSEIKLGDFKIQDVFQVSVNGNKIEFDFWSVTSLRSVDSVLISPQIQSGEGGSIFRVALQIAVVVAATYFTAGLSAPLAAGIIAATSIASSLLINALIPPPVQDIGDLAGDTAESSQMYTVTSQANVTNKLGTVPKVYGTHRIYPYVAALPYTDLETDPDTGKLVQYLYAIYDFGLGPMNISQFMIGDTPLEQFSDYTYNLVDLNKPGDPNSPGEGSEGPWDDATRPNFGIYFGDRQLDSVSTILYGNQNAGDAQDTYQAIRNTALNTDGSAQEISLQFVNQNGLFGYASNGAIGDRSILLDIQFAPVGTEDWHGYNEFDYVNGWTATGGGEEQTIVNMGMPSTGATIGGEAPSIGFPYSILNTVTVSKSIYDFPDGNTPPGYPVPGVYNGRPHTTIIVGVPAGVTQFIAQTIPQANLGAFPVLMYQGQSYGNIADQSPYAPMPGYSIFTMLKPLAQSFPIFTIGYYEPGYNGITPFTSYVTNITQTASLAYRSPSPGKARITRADTAPVYSTYKFTPKVAGQYKVRVIRQYTEGTYTYQTQDSLTWLTIGTRFARAPIITDKRHVFMELKIRATNQLNGTISNLSAVATSVLEVWNGTAWELQPTNNPAWIVADLLTGAVNKRAIEKSRLHMPSFIEMAAFASEIPDGPPDTVFGFQRFETNFVLDFKATVQAVINQVLSAAQGSLNVVEGKYGILIDRRRDIPVQIFTPRNSRDFSSQRLFTKRPDALKISYIDPALDWKVAEAVVYDNGFDEENAVETEDLSSFACTNFEQAWRFGRYMIAQNRLRQETIGLVVDFEHLVCSRGDYVQITQDVMRVGGTPARVLSVVGNRITIDDGITSVPATDYAYVFRGIDGLIDTSTLTIVNADTFDLDGPLPSVGDLIVIGELGKVVFDCIVKSISPNDDMSASLLLVEKADAIYDYESTDVFPDYNPQISNTSDPDNAPPERVEDLIVSDFGYDCSGDGYEYYIEVDWNPPSGSAYEVFEVFVNDGQGYESVATTRQSIYRYVVDQTRLGIEHSFKVLAVSATGKKLDLGAVTSVSQTPIKKTSAPSNVEFLNIDITNEVLQLVWSPVLDCDLAKYLIRYSPALDATWEASVPLLLVDKKTTLTTAQARTGTYLIKAIDYNDNESYAPAIAITTIPNLFNLNVIDEITDSPTWPGVFDRTEKIGDTILLQNKVIGGVEVAEYYSEGFYYYDQLLDLGEIYTVRLQSLIQAEGYANGDLMYTWITLESVAALASARYSEWDVETQYRSTETLNVIADWVTLASVDAMVSGVSENFTEWRKFIMGDATGRIFQFRLRLLSNKANITPRIYDGTIRADMPDRVESYDNLLANDTDGYILEFNPSFKGPGLKPNIQISIDDASSGDYWEFDYRDLDGFQIKFYDKNGVQVARQFDVVAKGYGRKANAVI